MSLRRPLSLSVWLLLAACANGNKLGTGGTGGTGGSGGDPTGGSGGQVTGGSGGQATGGSGGNGTGGSGTGGNGTGGVGLTGGAGGSGLSGGAGGSGGNVPPGWTCDPTWYGDATYCDCACGAFDVDCNDPALPVDGCAAGETCDANGQCTGGGNVPPGWTCDPTWYGDATYCDCACGAFDVDCNDPALPVDGCAAGETCDANGQCTGGGNVPPGWTCDPTWYGDATYCDCACGAVDVDCSDPALPVYGCAAGETCDASGQCTGGGGGVPPGWTCDPTWYGDATYCDCACGAVDVDCSDPALPVYGCAAGETCDASGQCTGGGGGVPPGWTCDPTWYGDATYCDCACGAVDVDCSDPALPVYGCAAGETCDASGQCTGGGGGVPPGWTCNPNYYDAQDGCDCACGAVDPDCAIPGATVYGCAAGETCDANGQCTGGGGGGVPPGWTCTPSYFGDGDCDCGCGALDTDCASGSAQVCLYNFCPPPQTPAANQNWLCQ